MKHVLIIEDDKALRENTSELLELANYTVSNASNGRMGVEKAIEIKPDIIICDIMMPEIDGYGVLEELSTHVDTQHIPFIFLSAKTEHSEVRKGMELGADDYLTKPFQEDDLIRAVEARLAKSNLLKSAFNKHDDEDEKVIDLHMLKNFFDDHGEIFEYDNDATIYENHHHANRVYLVLKGIVKIYNTDVDGKELVTALVEPDEFLGLPSFLDQTTYQENAIAVGNVELAGILKKDLKKLLLESHEVSLELMSVMAHNITSFKNQLLQMAYGSVRKKTAQTILHCSSIMNTGDINVIRVTRQDLASMAGIATESLIRTLSSFKKQGLITSSGRNITILDRKKLEQIS